MAQQILLTDDLDGKSAGKGGEVETFRFGLDGTDYEIDLRPQNAKSFLAMAQGYAERGRRVRTSGAPVTRGGHPKRVRDGRSADIRAWAKSAGVAVSESGRIPLDVIAMYDNRDNLPAAAAKFQQENDRSAASR